MDWNPKVENVLVQATYMSGDRNGIASALKVDETLGILILTAPGELSSGEELRKFYESIAGPGRVTSVMAPVAGDARASLSKAYKDATDPKKKNPAWLADFDRAGKITFQSATYGTKVIAGAYGSAVSEKVKKTSGKGTVMTTTYVPNPRRAEAARQQLQTLWRLPGDSLDKDEEGKTIRLEERIGQYLAAKGFVEDKLKKNQYVFLFAKQGDRLAEKAHHFTSILTWNLLKDKMLAEPFRAGLPANGSQPNGLRIIPVAAGDRIGLGTSPDLAEFWNEPEWKKIFQDKDDPTRRINIDPRSAQLGLWCYFAMHYPSVSIIGMRSGMIEVPALLGIRTLYLEEINNGQAVRMEKWLNNVVPGFNRQKVDVPPGIAQGLYWQNARTEDEKRREEQEQKTGRTLPPLPALTPHGEKLRPALQGMEGVATRKLNTRPYGWTPGPVPPNLKNVSRYPTVQGVARSSAPVNAPIDPTVSGVPRSPVVPDEQQERMNPVLAQIRGRTMDQFTLQDTEFNAIMEWIRAAP